MKSENIHCGEPRKQGVSCWRQFSPEGRILSLVLSRTKLFATKFRCKSLSVAQEGNLPVSWLYEKSKFFNEALFTSGRLPVRLLFPRNRNSSFSRVRIDRGTWPMILLKLKSSKIKFVSLDISTAPRLSDNLQFLNIL